MALSSSRLKTAAQLAIYNKLKLLQTPKIPDDVDDDMLEAIDQMWQDFATSVAECMTAVVAEFTSNAEVAVTNVTNVVAGSADSGPGTGTIS